MDNLETERLWLRRMQLSDTKGMFDLNADPEVTRYLPGDPVFATLDDAAKIVNYVREQYEEFDVGRLSVIHKQSKEFMGWCGLKYLPDEGEVDLGYRFKQVYWGQGYATEASEVCLRYGFEEMGLSRVVARALAGNIGSTRVMEKLGMTFDGPYTFNGERWEQYVITAADFLARPRELRYFYDAPTATDEA